MIQIDRSQIVLVWKDIVDNSYYCNFCHVSYSIIKTHRDFIIFGNCPIASRKCCCINVYNNKLRLFNNKEHTILATIYKCYMKQKQTECRRNCDACIINGIITKLYNENQYESQ